MRGTERQIDWAQKIVAKFFPEAGAAEAVREIIPHATAWIDVSDYDRDEVRAAAQTAVKTFPPVSDQDNMSNQRDMRASYMFWFLVAGPKKITMLSANKGDTVESVAADRARHITETIAVTNMPMGRIDGAIQRRIG